MPLKGPTAGMLGIDQEREGARIQRRQESLLWCPWEVMDEAV